MSIILKLLQCQSSHFLTFVLKHIFVNKGIINTSRFFPSCIMRNLLKNLNIIRKPSILPYFLFSSSKNFHPHPPPPFPSILEKSNPPHPLLWRGHSNYVKSKFDKRETNTKSCLKYFPVKSCICRNQPIDLLGLPWIGFCFLLKGICKYNLLPLNSCKFVMHCSWTNQLPKSCKSIEKCLTTNKKQLF